MAKPTKDKILDAAVRCFNRDGMVNVRLQHIGDEAEWMSVGNLAYHFRTKEHIVQAIWERLVAEQRGLETARDLRETAGADLKQRGLEPAFVKGNTMCHLF
ncbi:MAG: helix-turn-helix transcriptional regulator [Saprospiraceae bacterium]|nr:helix-turn-helix transcriptional regulator [Saprospiraceae bacterium]